MNKDNQESRLKRLKGEFHWSNKSRFPGIEKPDQRVPILWIGPRSGDENLITEYYLVNNTNEYLDLVTTDTGGFATIDEDDPDGVMTLSESERSYTKVEPDEAVLLTKYDEMFDSDFALQLSVSTASKSLGKLSFTMFEKGGFGTVPLLYPDGDSKYLIK